MFDDIERDRRIRNAIRTVIELAPDEISEALIAIDYILKQDTELTGRVYRKSQSDANVTEEDTEDEI